VPVNFFRHIANGAADSLPTLPPGLQMRCWAPAVDGPPPPGSRTFANHFWWALGNAGRFARPDFAEISVRRDSHLIHRLIVTPAWYRFPFMAPEDLQIGTIWTSPEARRKQLARAAIGEAHRRFGTSGTCFWYVADAGNHASEALARSCGYELVATGRRTRRCGTALLGQYVIDRFL
jgi:RimJ/RimL family protein N-acetyltransferase